MHFHGLPSRLFGSPARTAVVTTMLAAPDIELTGREVARRAGVSPPRALDALRVLEAEGLCVQRRVGRASLWAVDRRHFLARQLRSLASLELDARAELCTLLANRLDRAGAAEAYLFGPLARGEERATSDIDLLAVFPDERHRSLWTKALPGLQDEVQALFGNELQAIAYTTRSVTRGPPRMLLQEARASGWRVGGRE